MITGFRYRETKFVKGKTFLQNVNEKVFKSGGIL